jgi:hypothetical protein
VYIHMLTRLPKGRAEDAVLDAKSLEHEMKGDGEDETLRLLILFSLRAQ